MSNKSKQNIKDSFEVFGQLKRYKFVESFCGAGGISLGLTRIGFELGFAFDLNDKAVATHTKNFPNEACEIADASQITSQYILKKIGMKKGELPLFAGGPPCQGFSKQKRGAHLGDKRNELVSHYIRLVKELEPKFFLFENVAIFGQKRGEKFLNEMIKTFTHYKLYPHFYNSADYGLAQTRERFVIVGRRLDQKAPFQMPQPTIKKWKTVGDILKGLPEPPEDYSVHTEYPNHQRARVTELNIKRFSHVPQGGGWKDIPQHLRLECHKGNKPITGGWPDVYGRLEWNGQCPTITGGFDSFTRGRYGHPLHDRPITPREAARLQGFPDSFEFIGNRGDVRTQIGNAVPPPLASAIGLEIMRSLLIADNEIEEDFVDQSAPMQLEMAI